MGLSSFRNKGGLYDMKSSHITVTDLFCGAGGSSQGVRNLAKRHNGGIEVKLAMNHWKLAIETHNTNFPDTLHDCTDISACDPRRYPSTTIAVMSPECTTLTPAGGNTHKALKKQMDLFNSNKVDPSTERSRATMWDVCRFAEYHQYESIVVENVVEAKTRWVLFDAWLNAMQLLGYNHKCVYLNSMHCHPTPQSRDRMYVVFWKKGNKAPDLEYKPLAYSPRIGKNVYAIQSWKNPLRKFGKYKQQYVYCCPHTGDIVEPYYYAAFNFIDWSDPGQRIGDRIKPLADNTISRINYGLNKFGTTQLLVTTKYHSERIENGSRLLTDAMRTQPTEQSHAIFNPFLIDDKHTSGLACRVRGVQQSTGTLHCDPRVKIVTPFIIKTEQSSNKDGYVRKITDAAQTQSTWQTDGLVLPYIITNRGQSKAHNITVPLTTQSCNVTHGIVTPEASRSFLSYYNRTHHASHITEASLTQPTNDRLSLITNVTPKIEDCFYRMIKPGEVKLAMAFDSDYIIKGSGKDQVRQCGNAVTPPAMEWLIGQVVESLS